VQYAAVIKTGAPRAVLIELGRKIAAIPPGFNAHRVVARVFAERAAAIEKGAGVDWGFAEALAIGCTLKDSMRVRLSGQDVSRGSFCHRHAVIYDQKSGAPFSPLSTVVPDAARLLQVTNSPLAETAEMGACARVLAWGMRVTLLGAQASSSATRTSRPSSSCCGRPSSATL
jgi:2-oxoglutarate dehydrogenase E1 component